jgi:hypothetical protein
MTDLLRQFIREQLLEDLAKRKKLAQDLSSSELFMHISNNPEEREATEPHYDERYRGRELKKVFAKYADRQFLNSLVTTHWKMAPEPLESSPRDEISCAATLPGQYSLGWKPGRTAFGIVVKGHITLLANSMNDLTTGMGKRIAKAYPNRTRSSGANKGVRTWSAPEDFVDPALAKLVLDRADWKPRIIQGWDLVTDDVMDQNWNEALVDNWQIVAYVVRAQDVQQRVEEMIEKGQLSDHPVLLFSEAKQRF